MSDKKIKISVIMTVYNAERFLEDAIESVLDQTFSNFEFIILNDGSTDRSYKIICEYANKDNRIIVLNNERNTGIAKARTKCVKHAKGKYIATVDADDISEPMRFKKQYDYLEKYKNCGVVGGFLEIFDSETGETIGFRKYYEDDSRLRKKIFFYSPIANPASMIRKEVYDNIGYYDPEYPPADDVDFWFRLGKKYKFANIQEVLVKYRVHRNSATVKNINHVKDLTIKIRKKYMKGYGYSCTFLDKVFLFSLMGIKNIIPGNFIFRIFNFIRDDKPNIDNNRSVS